MTRRMPFGTVWGWPGSFGHPLLKLFGLVGVVLATVVLIAASVVALVLDILFLPFRLLL